jgi:nitrogen fixation protein FixH
MSAQVKTAGTLTGRKVLAWLIGFFLVVASVNAVFIYAGIKSWPGLVSERPYEDGLAYNRTLAVARANAALGWRAQLGYRDGQASLVLADRDGRAIDGMQVEAVFTRPVGKAAEIAVTLAALGGGRYAAPAALPLAGQWEMVVTVDGARDRFIAADRVIVK